MAMAAPDPAAVPADDLIVGFCVKCNRKTYVHDHSDMFCSVCSSPLAELDQEAENEPI